MMRSAAPGQLACFVTSDEKADEKLQFCFFVLPAQCITSQIQSQVLSSTAVQGSVRTCEDNHVTAPNLWTNHGRRPDRSHPSAKHEGKVQSRTCRLAFVCVCVCARASCMSIIRTRFKRPVLSEAY